MHNPSSKIVPRVFSFILILAVLLSLCNYAMYNDSNHRRVMMHEMYTHNPPIDLAFLGGSVAYVHFDPEIWNGVLGLNTFNLGSDMQSPDATYFLAKELFKNHNPKYCIYSVSYLSFLKGPDYDNPTKDYILFDYFRPSMNKLEYWMHAFDEQTALKAVLPFLRWKESLSISSMIETVKVKLSEGYRSYAHYMHLNEWAQYRGEGYVAVNDGKKEGNVGRVYPPKFDMEHIDRMKLTYFQKLVDLCKKNDCELILLATPIPYAAMSMHEDYQQICSFYTNLAEENGVKLFDFTLVKPGVLEMEDIDFYDHVHMNGPAEKKFSIAASEVIKQYICGESIDESQSFYNGYQELLNTSSYVFNTWLEPIGGGYVAKSTYGTGVIPEYRFFVRDEETAPWKILYSYGEKDNLSRDDLPENTVQIRIEARPQGSSDEYQQYDIYSISD